MSIPGSFGVGSVFATEATLREVRDGIDGLQQRFSYYEPVAGLFEIRYLGASPQGTQESAVGWVIRRLEHTMLGGVPKLISVQTLSGIWLNRELLPWA